jgi:hypothetical protein
VTRELSVAFGDSRREPDDLQLGRLLDLCKQCLNALHDGILDEELPGRPLMMMIE